MKANVCCVQFPPDSARSLAVGSADHKIYCFDLRNMKVPWCTLIGHTRTVSYVKFVDSNTIVSASTDNSLKLWDLTMNKSQVLNSPVQTYTGHTNVKVHTHIAVSFLMLVFTAKFDACIHCQIPSSVACQSASVYVDGC